MWVSGDKFLVYLICILSHNLNMLKDNRKKHEVLGLEQNLIIKFIIYYTDVTYLPSQVALVVKNLSANTGDLRDTGSIPGLGRSPGEGNGNPLQYSCLENPMDRGAWWATVHGVTKSWT